MSSNEGIVVEYEISIDSDGNAVVTALGSAQLRLNVDSVLITSTDKRTAIRCGQTSPFKEPEVGPGTILLIDGPKGPFKYVTAGTHHFDCGFINPVNQEFQKWGVKGVFVPGGGSSTN